MYKRSMEELGRLDTSSFKDSEKTPVRLILDNVRSMHNIGSVFRTADAFRFESVLLCGITATPPHREIHKTALGATETVRWRHYTTSREALEECKKDGYIVALIEQAHGSILLNQFVPDNTKKYALVMGNEVSGVADDLFPLADVVIEIPQWGSKHSLNISVATGIVSWHFSSVYHDQ